LAENVSKFTRTNSYQVREKQKALTAMCTRRRPGRESAWPDNKKKAAGTILKG
jgi:hypothetical protein